MRAEQIFCISTTFEPRTKIWYQLNRIYTPPPPYPPHAQNGPRPQFFYYSPFGRWFWCCLFFVWSCRCSLRGFFSCFLLLVVLLLCLFGKRELVLYFSLVCDMFTIFQCLSVLPLGVINRLCSAFLAIYRGSYMSGHLI